MVYTGIELVAVADACICSEIQTYLFRGNTSVCTQATTENI